VATQAERAVAEHVTAPREAEHALAAVGVGVGAAGLERAAAHDVDRLGRRAFVEQHGPRG
jgi:hypothetical protein